MIRRCAIYTRKSTERGLEQAFNSLSAQREACAAYIKCQEGEGWVPVNGSYDDGGYSGGSVERPAFQRLLRDIRAGLIDVIVVSKVDRFTRSLTDFAKIVELLDTQGVSFVAVTQQFNTTTSMGRLTLNMLLSFAQFEREVTSERIREKVLASRRKGLWMGGTPPLGYSAEGGRLHVKRSEAGVVNEIFRAYLKLGDVGAVVIELRARGVTGKSWRSKRGIDHPARALSRGAINHVLGNPVYIGVSAHRGVNYPGQHDPIISLQIWNRTQSLLKSARRRNFARRTVTPRSFLSGKIYDELARKMVVSVTKKSPGRMYRYYQSVRTENCDEQIVRVSADALESLVIKAVLTRSSREFGRQFDKLTEKLKGREIRASLKRVTIMETNALTTFLDDRGVEQVVATPFRPRRNPVTKIVRPLDAAKVSVSTTNSSLLCKLATAHHWREALEEGEVQSLKEIARSENRPLGEVKDLIRLAFLSPALIEKVLGGRLPPSLTSDELVRLAAEPNWRIAALGRDTACC